MSVIRWEDPPARHGNADRRRRSRFDAYADALRDRPGAWAVIVEGKTQGAAAGLAHRIRTGVGAFAPPGAFEAKAIGPGQGSSAKVYARYVGEESDA